MAGRHKGGTKVFRELTFAEQARSITATINNLEAAIEHHVEHSPRRLATIEVCLAQVDRLRQRLRASYDQRGSRSGPAEPALGVEEVPRLHVGSPRLAEPERAADFTMEVTEEP
jgi:hypothetical protein